MLGEFAKLFPKIKPNYTRLQAGALYAKVTAERQAKTYTVDAMQISDMGMILDFQKKNGYVRYVSPQMAAYKEEYKSRPEGYWTWGAIGPAGLAYNPNVVPADQAPKTWEEAIDPKWTDGITVKLSTSGLQHVSWFELRGLYGPDYWKKFGELKPKGFDSYVQQFDRLVNQQDKIIHTAQYAGYLEWKKKGAPVGFNSPAGRAAGHAGNLGHSNRRAPPQCGATVSRLVSFRSRTEGNERKPVSSFGQARRRAAARRRAPRKDQIADARRLGGFSQEPYRIRQGVGQIHWSAVDHAAIAFRPRSSSTRSGFISASP